MQLNSVRLQKYGSFADLTVALSDTCSVIYGANEAGKSTLLHGLGDFLWGIKKSRHPHAHTHAKKPSDMRITGTLTIDGEQIELVRRLQELTDSDGGPVEPPWVSDEHGSRDAWNASFGMDLDGLQRGGRAVLQGEGDLAGVIFLAETGRRLDEVRASLDVAAQALYVKNKGAKRVRVRELLTALGSGADSIRSTLVNADEVAAAREALADAERLVAERTRAHVSAQTQDRRAEELLRCWQTAIELSTVEQDLAQARADGDVLDPAATAQLQRVVGDRRNAEQTIVDRTAERAAVEARLLALQLQPQLLAQGAQITAIAGKLAQAESARALLSDDTAVLDAERAVGSLLEDLGSLPSADLPHAVAAVRVSVEQRAQLDQLAGQVHERATALRNVQDRLAGAERQLAGLTSAGAQATDTSGLRAARTQRDEAWQAVRQPWIDGQLPVDPTERLQFAIRVDVSIESTDGEAERHGEDLAAAAERRALLDQAERARHDIRHLVDQADGSVRKAIMDWDSFAQNCGLTPGLRPEHWAARRKKLDELAPAWDDLGAQQQKRAQAARTLAAFGDEVAPLRELLTHAPDDAIACAAALRDAVAHARQAEAAAVVHRQQITDLTAGLRQLHSRSQEAAGQIDAVMAGRSTAIETLLARSIEVRGLTDLRTSKLDLLNRSKNPDSELESLRAALVDGSPEVLSAQAASAKENLTEANDALQRAREDRTLRHDALERLESGQSIAAMTAEQQGTGAELEATVMEYQSLRVQLALLDAYRQDVSQRGGKSLLEGAGGFLSNLTDGRYDGFSPIIEDGRRSLRILRRNAGTADSEEMELGELSEGSADQAFLSLRLAGIQQRLSRIGSAAPPVVLDDVLMAFDDQRSLAALHLFAELGAQFQIILLTHHRRIMEQARTVGGIKVVELV